MNNQEYLAETMRLLDAQKHMSQIARDMVIAMVTQLVGWEVCTNCKEFCQELFTVPRRYADYGFAFTLPQIMTLPKSNKRVCAYCISVLATKKRRLEEKKYRVRLGHLFTEDWSLGKEQMRDWGPGFSYVAQRQRDGLYKIGATQECVSSRISSLGNRHQITFVRALECQYPFKLESALHIVFADRRRKLPESSNSKYAHMPEYFRLTVADLDYLATVQTIDDLPIIQHKTMPKQKSVLEMPTSIFRVKSQGHEFDQLLDKME